MATTKQGQAAKRSIKKALPTTSTKKAIARMPKQAASALNKRGAKPITASALNKRGAKLATASALNKRSAKPATTMAARKRTTSAMAMTRTQLYALAQKRDLPGRSKMGRDQLAKALGVR